MKTLLWIIIAVVLIGGGWFAVMHFSGGGQSVQPAVVPIGQVVQPQTLPASSQSNTTNTTASNASSLTCDDVFPLNFLQNVFPQMQFHQINIASSSIELTCSYGAVVAPSSGSDMAGYDVILDILPSSTGSYSTTISNVESVSNGDNGNETCSTSSIGAESTECISPTLNDIPFEVPYHILNEIFVNSNKEYDVIVTLYSPSDFAQARTVAEQMAKEVDSKLSSY